MVCFVSFLISGFFLAPLGKVIALVQEEAINFYTTFKIYSLSVSLSPLLPFLKTLLFIIDSYDRCPSFLGDNSRLYLHC